MKPMPCPFCNRLPVTRTGKLRDTREPYSFTMCPQHWSAATNKARCGNGDDAHESEADWNRKVLEMKP